MNDMLTELIEEVAYYAGSLNDWRLIKRELNKRMRPGDRALLLDPEIAVDVINAWTTITGHSVVNGPTVDK